MAEVDSVLLGESIFIDWKSGLEPAIYAKYSTPGWFLYLVRKKDLIIKIIK